MEEEKSFKKLKDRTLYILKSGKWSDVSFLVGNTKNTQRLFTAHQLILAIASPVFDRMFYGHFPITDEPIVIPDIKPDTFQILLDYMYIDVILISSMDKACDLLYAAKKYMLPHVVQQCMHFLWTNLRPKNACRTYEVAKLFDETGLMERSMEVIVTQTRHVIAEPSFLDIEVPTLMAILQQNRLNVDEELDLFNCLLKFANERSVVDDGNDDNRTETSSSVSNIADEETVIDIFAFSMDIQRTIMNEAMLRQAVKTIRFLTMTPHQFAEGPAKSKLLQEHETLAILMNILSPSVNECPMPEGFCKSRSFRSSSYSQSVHLNASTSFLVTNGIDIGEHFEIFNPSAGGVRSLQGALVPTDVTGTSSSTNPSGSVCNAAMTLSYCERKLTHQIEYCISSGTDFYATFQVDTSIWILGVEIRTQIFGENSHESERYTDNIYAQLQNMQTRQIAYTQFKGLVRYDSLLDIMFNRPVYVQSNEICKVYVFLSVIGWYTMNSYEPEIVSNGVKFTFSLGTRDGLIHAIIFSKPNNMIE